MVDKTLLFWAIVFMLIFIVKDFLKKKYNIDMDNIDVIKKLKQLQKHTNPNSKEQLHIINKGTGNHSLVLLDAGTNKATVMATLRQITGLDYNSAKAIVESAPSTFMKSISDKEADLTKKALEFVGAKIEIK